MKVDVRSSTLLEPYPAERYQAVREGLMTSDEFVEDLIRFVARRLDLERSFAN